jgi:tRNA-binding EMAP/Myf-like protein
MRVGKIVECMKHPDADSLYVEKIDLGEGKLRTVCSGLVKYIPLEEMLNKLVVCICNLKPAKMRGILSEAMVLCASTPEKVELVQVPQGATIGDKIISLDYEQGNPATECNTKNNYFGIVAADLKTNDSLVVNYKDSPLVIKGKGELKSLSLKNVPVK